jgi:M6 family metalloprotease-like protein
MSMKLRLTTVGCALSFLGVGPTDGSAQDVEMLAEQHGTRPPPGYYDQMRRDPASYRWRGRAWRPALRFDDPNEPGAGRAPGPARASGGTSPSGPSLILGPREGPVAGDVVFPLLLGLYSDSPDPSAPFRAQDVEEQYFTGPNPNGATLTEYYAELSFGRLNLQAEVFDWTRSRFTNAEVTGNSNGLTSTDDVGEFIIDLLTQLDDGTVDWGRFDDDGPDGIPNSGDDDGFIDVLAVMHPSSGAECTSDSDDVWSHKWQLAATAGQIYATRSQRPNGSPIFADNYVIVPSRACPASVDPDGLMEIGTLAHEVGHGFGLPDLYATGSDRHAGIGRWGLMGSGSWGCRGNNYAKPCGMTAWTKEALGWAEVVTLDRDLDHGTVVLDPVATSNRILRIEAGDGSGVYYLLENRQAIGADSDVFAPGLLVWQISPFVVLGNWTLNAVNAESDDMGVWLRQADGDNDLGRRSGGNKGDSGDPFPGIMQNREFHAGSTPSATTNFGTSASGVTLLDVEQVGDQMHFRVLTRFQTVTVEAEGNSGQGLFRLDGVPQARVPLTFDSAPFERHTVEAVGGEETGDGFRNGFIGWETPAARVREWQTGLEDAVLTATYGNPEVRFDVELLSPLPGVVPGSISTTPPSDQGWIRQGTEVTVLAEPATGFGFVEWTGNLSGRPNPFSIMLNEPTTGGATFEVAFQVAETPSVIPMEAAVGQTIAFIAENANQPVTWTRLGNLPPGVSFVSSVGELRGAPLREGAFPIRIRATDAVGLQDEVFLTLEVGPPSVGLVEMAAPFLQGTGLSPALSSFLDLQGNRSGDYDLADFRIYVIGHPNAPASAPVVTLAEPLHVPLFVRREQGR